MEQEARQPKIIRLELTPGERAELGRRLRARTSEPRTFERLRIIQAVGDGATIPQAARTLGLHEQTVRKCVVRFAAEGFAGLADRPRAGRPPVLTEEDLAAVEARLDAAAATGAHTWTLPQLAAWLAETRGVVVTPGHLGERLKARDFRWKRTKRSTAHKQSDYTSPTFCRTATSTASPTEKRPKTSAAGLPIRTWPIPTKMAWTT